MSTFANKSSLLNVTLDFVANLSDAKLAEDSSMLILGQSKNLKKVTLPEISATLEQLKVTPSWYTESITYLTRSKREGGEAPGSSVSWLNKLCISKISSVCSRTNAPSRANLVPKMVRANSYGSKTQHILVACERKHAVAYACAIARSFPLFSAKTIKKSPQRFVSVSFLFTDGEKNETANADELKSFNVCSGSTRLSAKIVDMPCADMHTDAFLAEIRAVGKSLGIEPVVIEGEELQKRGMGGLWNVGKAAVNSPKLVILSHIVPEATRTVAWVGKGIVYDTGGLSIKPTAGMCSMKIDCGGAAGILGAFSAAVQLGFKQNLHGVFCLAENAVGPNAYRPDDIIKLYSGKTVEINNTDAEGRLVLGDGVAYAEKDLKADVIVDMATLTGAQGICVGQHHAGIVSNMELWERAGVDAGKSTGDLCYPMVYAPELHFSQFDSEVADMKNSVAKGNNASSSCAGLFVQSHLSSDYKGIWVHLDMASMARDDSERATGYGTGILNGLFGNMLKTPLFNAIAPTNASELPFINTEIADEE